MKNFISFHFPWSLLIFISGVFTVSSFSSSKKSSSSSSINVSEGATIKLNCHFSSILASRSRSLYWIHTNHDGHDNVAIDSTKFGHDYVVNYDPSDGVYDLTINNVNYDRDNGKYECRMKEKDTGKILYSKSIDLIVLMVPSAPTISPVQTTITEGRTLNLTCSSIGGSPPPKIKWYLRDLQIEENIVQFNGATKDEPTTSVLTIVPLKKDDGNTYRCNVESIALDPRQKLQASTRINVNYFPRVTVGPEIHMMVEKGDTAVLECHVDSKPIVNSVKWTRNGRFFETHFQHKIQRVTIKDAGIYVCLADNELGQSDKAELTLEVLHKPVINIPKRKEVGVGHDVEVFCEVDAIPKTSIVVWYKMGDKSFHQNGQTLRLRSVSARDNGHYICSATNHLRPSGKSAVSRTTNATIEINIRHVPGQAFITPKHAVAIDGKKFILTCGANPPGYPVPQYTWRKEGSKATLSVRSLLVFESAHLNHAGKYVCIPHNEMGEGSLASIELVVHQEPKIITYFQPIIMKRSGDTGFQITCTAVGKPKPEVTWFLNGREINNIESNMIFKIDSSDQETIPNMSYKVLSTLNFVGNERIGQNQLMSEDKGQYTCQFKNAVGTNETTMILKIEHAPKVLHQHNKVAFDLGESAFITCKMEAFPAPHFDWSFGNTVLQIDRYEYESNTTNLGDDTYEGTLKIKTVSESSYGEYICKGSNSMGAKRTIIKLQPKSKPSKPSNLYLDESSSRNILLGWEEGFNGGYDDTMFTVQYYKEKDKSPRYLDCRHHNPCNISNLDQFSLYFIKVKASNIRGESKYSDEISIMTKIDASQIPKPSNFHYEKSTKTASFVVVGNNEPLTSSSKLVAKIELEMSDGTWHSYRDLSLNEAKFMGSEVAIKIDHRHPVNNLRVRLCLESNSLLCSTYATATIVDVRLSQQNGVTAAAVLNQTWIIVVSIFVLIALVVGISIITKFYFCKGSGRRKVSRRNPPPPAYQPYGVENKGVDTLKDVHGMADSNIYHTGDNTNTSGYVYPEAVQSSNSANSANGGSVNSQDSLWNVKNGANMPGGGYYANEHMAYGATGPEYSHYPYPDEYINDRNRQYINHELSTLTDPSVTYGTINRQQNQQQMIEPCMTEYTQYADMNGLPVINSEHHQQYLLHQGDYNISPQMVYDAGDDSQGGNFGPSGNTGGSRRIIREIIV